MTTPRKPRSAGQNLLIAIAAMLALVAGYYMGNIASGKKPELQTATVLPEPRALSDFSLVDKYSKPMGLAQLKGKWSLLFFGYTHCPDICPTALTGMSELYNKLTDNVRDQVQALFISVDPQRDTPEHLKAFVEFYNPVFLAGTGDATEISKLAKQVGIMYKIHEPDTTGNYLVDHSSWLIVINPNGEFHAVISGSHFQNTQAIADDLASIVGSF